MTESAKQSASRAQVPECFECLSALRAQVLKCLSAISDQVSECFIDVLCI